MKAFFRLAVGFFVLCVVVAGVAYFFGSSRDRAAIRSSETPVGQLPVDHVETSPGLPAEQK